MTHSTFSTITKLYSSCALPSKKPAKLLTIISNIIVAKLLNFSNLKSVDSKEKPKNSNIVFKTSNSKSTDKRLTFMERKHF